MQKSLIAVLMASALLSLDASAADLVQVYNQALANDAQYASARAALAAGQERVPQGRAGLLPTVALSGSNTRNSGDFVPVNEGQLQVVGGNLNVPSRQDTDNHVNTYNLTLSQPLFRWANWQQYQQSKLALATAEAQFALAQQDLITRVAQAYFDVLTAQDNLGATQSQKTATTEQLASAKRNFEVGTQTITDTHEAQAAYDLVVAQEFAAINDLDNKRTALQAIIGQTPAALSPIRAGVSISAPQPAAVETWVGSAEQQNYGVITAQLTLETAKRSIEVSRAGHYPTVDLVAEQAQAAISPPVDLPPVITPPPPDTNAMHDTTRRARHGVAAQQVSDDHDSPPQRAAAWPGRLKTNAQSTSPRSSATGWTPAARRTHGPRNAA